MIVDRETLYDELWAEPAAMVAKRYGPTSFQGALPSGYLAQASVGRARTTRTHERT